MAVQTGLKGKFMITFEGDATNYEILLLQNWSLDQADELTDITGIGDDETSHIDEEKPDELTFEVILRTSEPGHMKLLDKKNKKITLCDLFLDGNAGPKWNSTDVTITGRNFSKDRQTKTLPVKITAQGAFDFDAAAA